MTIWVLQGGILAVDHRHSRTFNPEITRALEGALVGTHDGPDNTWTTHHVVHDLDTVHTLESKLRTITVPTDSGDVTLYATGSGKLSIITFLIDLAISAFNRDAQAWVDAISAEMEKVNRIPERKPFSTACDCIVVGKEYAIHVDYTPGAAGGLRSTAIKTIDNTLLVSIGELNRFFRISSHANKEDEIVPYAARIAAQACYLFPDSCSPPIDYVNVLADAPTIKTLSQEDVDAYAVRSGMIYRPPAPPQDSGKS